MATTGSKKTGASSSQAAQPKPASADKKGTPALKRGFFGPSPSSGNAKSTKPAAKTSTAQPASSNSSKQSTQTRESGGEQSDALLKKGFLEQSPATNNTGPSSESYTSNDEEYPQLLPASDSESEYEDDIDLVKMFAGNGRKRAGLSTQEMKELHARVNELINPPAEAPAASVAPSKPAEAKAPAPKPATAPKPAEPEPSSSTVAKPSGQKQEKTAAASKQAKVEAEGGAESKSMAKLRKTLELASEGRMQALIEEDERRQKGAQKSGKQAKRKAQGKKAKQKARKRASEAGGPSSKLDADAEPEPEPEKETQPEPELAVEEVEDDEPEQEEETAAAAGSSAAAKGPAEPAKDESDASEAEEGDVAESDAVSQNPFDLLLNLNRARASAGAARQKEPLPKRGGAAAQGPARNQATEDDEAQWQVEQRSRAARNRPGPHQAQGSWQEAGGPPTARAQRGGRQNFMAGHGAAHNPDAPVGMQRPRPSGRGRGMPPPVERAGVRPGPGFTGPQAPPKRGGIADVLWGLPAVPVPKPQAFDSAHVPAGGQEEEDGEENMCIVCMEWPSQVVLFPCGHSNMCPTCAEKVRGHGEGLCPSCRTPIEGIRPLG